MGNKKLRKLVAAKLKQNAYGKLYTGGTKFQAYRSLNAKQLKEILFRLNLAPGDIVNDCDLFNHVIESIPMPTWSFRLRNSRIKTYWNSQQFKYTDGTYSCGCPWSPANPLTATQIRKLLLEYKLNFDCNDDGFKTQTKSS